MTGTSDARSTDVLPRLAGIVEELTAVSAERVQPERHWLKDLEIDSLALLEILVVADGEFGVRIPDDELTRFERVGDVVAFVEAALRS